MVILMTDLLLLTSLLKSDGKIVHTLSEKKDTKAGAVPFQISTI